MFRFPRIDPVILSLGSFKIRWYGLMYLLGFLGALIYLIKNSSKPKYPWTKSEIIDLFFYIALGIIFGGKIGYILFYQPQQIIENPLSLIQFWVAGRSFHAGLIGGFIGVWFFAKKHKRKIFEITDYLAPAIPIGLGLGRIGNFINAELWGKITDVPWGVIFPYAGNEPRHPTQIYEFLLEGLVLFIVLAIYNLKSRKTGSTSGWFLILYAIFRSFIEFYRVPDYFLGYLYLDWLTMGQLLSFPMLIIGLWLVFVYRDKGRG